MPGSERFLEALHAGKPALGMWINDAATVELAAWLGFDWFMIDQMFTSNGWQHTESLIRAGEASGITPIVRVQSNPWLGYDHRMAVDVSRLLGIGAQFVIISVSGKEEVVECASVSHDWHRRALTIHPFKGPGEWDDRIGEIERDTYVIPSLESAGGLEAMEAIFSLPEVKIVRLAMTDASRVITGKQHPDWESRELWAYLDNMVDVARAKGGWVGANTSYAYTMREMADRVCRLHEHGAQMILVQGAPFLFQVAMQEFLNDLRPRLNLA